MEFRILGPLEVLDGGRTVELPRRKHRALLAALLLRVGETVSSDRLIEELWGEQPPRTARDALQNYVSLLRKALTGDMLVTRDAGYRLEVAREQIDAARFEDLLAEGKAIAAAERRADTLREALGLWRGPPLADLSYEPFAAIEIARLEELRLAARQDLLDTELELGRAPDVVPELESLIREYPFDERLRGQLMIALYRAGRQAEALSAYREARRMLADELGLEPSPSLRELEQAILRHDPGLAAGGAQPAAQTASRRTVTVLSAGAAPEGADPEAIGSWLEHVRAAVERHGGRFRFVGDGALGVFGVPAAHEDDSLRAVRAAVESRDAAARLRIGLSTGEVYAGGDVIAGAPVTEARRLEQSAAEGETLVAAATLRLVRDAVRARRHAGGGPVAFRLERLIGGAPPLARRLDAPLVGREAELAVLRRAFDGAGDGSCSVLTLIGEAGIGKTRLARELTASVAAATVLVGHCVSYGEGATYLPLEEMVGEEFADLLAGAATTGELFLTVRTRLEEQATRQPLVLVFEDLHWAEPTLLDLIAYVGEHAVGPILVLCVTRPDLLAERVGWSDTGTSLVLEPLSDDQARELAGDSPLAERIVEIAEGNPLFVEQLAAYVEEGGEEALASVPGSIEALLAARLDRLGADERAVAGRASVVGRSFSLPALAALGPTEALSGLEKIGLVHPDPDGGFGFHHVLVRDVAYAGVPKAQRAELHERHADWLDGRPEGTDELIGHHLEQAAGCRRDLGAPEPLVERLATQAGRRLGAAGIRSWKRGDAAATVNLLGRASSLLPEHDPERLELMCELGGALQIAGELPQADQVLAEAVRLAAGDRRVELRARLELGNLRSFRDPATSLDGLLDVASEAIPVFEASGDRRSLSRAWFLSASIRGPWFCQFAAAEQALRRGIASAGVAGSETGWPTAALLGGLAAALFYGPTPVPDALRECEQLLSETDLNTRANVLGFVSALRAMRADFDEARLLVAEARTLYEALGQAAQAESACGAFEGEIELLAGDLDAAEQALRKSCDALERLGHTAYLATRAAALADVLARLERDDEAERWATVCARYTVHGDRQSEIPLRGVRARLAAHAARFDEADTLARDGLRLAETTDALGIHARAWLDLGEVQHLSGRNEHAAWSAGQALELFERKGNVAAATQVPAFLAPE